MNQIYGAENIEESFKLEATQFASMVLENDGGKFRYRPLPRLAQVSSINGIEVLDVNGDRHPDLIIAGNLYGTEVETTRYDASIGLVLLGDGQLNFNPVSTTSSGVDINHNCKGMSQIKLASGMGIISANNNGPVQLFRLNYQSTNTTLP